MHTLLIASLILLSASALAQSQASLTITQNLRTTWDDGTYTNYLYDITITNGNSFDVTNINFDLTGPSPQPTAGGPSLAQEWNIIRLSGSVFRLSEDGSTAKTLSAGQVYTGAGYVTRGVQGSVANAQGSRVGASSSSSSDESGSSSVSESSSSSSAASGSSSEPASGTCSTVTATQTLRTQWQDNGTPYYLYDISVTNSGSKTVHDVVLVVQSQSDLISSQDGNSITQEWNLVELAGTNSKSIPFTLVENGAHQSTSISAGQTYTGAGYVVRGVQTTLSTDVTCGTESSSSSSASSASSAESSSSSTESGSASSAASSSSEAPAGSCSASATIAQDGASWTDAQGRNTAVYRITLTNTGSKPLKHYVTSFALNGGETTSTWNLNSSLGGYEVVGFGPSLAPGQSYSGAGLIVAGAPEVTLTPYGSAC